MSVYYRALVIASKQVEIDLLTYGEGQDVLIPGVRIIRAPSFSFLGPVKTGPSLLKIFLDFFITIWTLGLLLRRRYNFVHAHEEAIFIAALFQPLFRYKLVYDMHSSLPEQLNNFGWSKSNILRRFVSWAEDVVLRRSQAIITICPALADFATSRIEDQGKHFLIENSIFEPVRLVNRPSGDENSEDIDAVYDEMHANGFTEILIYAGTLETYQGIDLLLESMTIVKRERGSVGLIIVGGSEEQVHRFKSDSRKLSIDDTCLFTGRISQSSAKQFVSKADIVLSPRTRGMNTPLKVYELLDSGKPMVATRIPSHTQVLDDHVAFLAEPEAEDFARQILAAVSDADLVQEKIKNARELYRSRYSREVYEEKIERLLELIR